MNDKLNGALPVYRVIACKDTATLEDDLNLLHDAGYSFIGVIPPASRYGGMDIARIVLMRDPDFPALRTERLESQAVADEFMSFFASQPDELESSGEVDEQPSNAQPAERPDLYPKVFGDLKIAWQKDHQMWRVAAIYRDALSLQPQFWANIDAAWHDFQQRYDPFYQNPIEPDSLAASLAKSGKGGGS